MKTVEERSSTSGYESKEMKELLLIRHGEADHNVLFAQSR